MSASHESHLHTTQSFAAGSFIGQPYCATFLQQLGLREVKDGDHTLITWREARAIPPDIDDVSQAMKQRQRHDNVASPIMLDMLLYILNALNRHRDVAPFVGRCISQMAVSKAVLQRFNDTLGFRCSDLTELSYKINDNIAEANEVFNTLRICDPSVGTGDFPVMLLDTLIAIKSQLGILADEAGNPLFHYRITTDGGALAVFDKRTLRPFVFHPDDPESHRIHTALLLAKRNLIENCLFAVDADPQAVGLARLRLWAELLRHTCWDESRPLSLPFVEPNIRCGDALIQRFSLDEPLDEVFKRINCTPDSLRQLALDCKRTADLDARKALQQSMMMIKRKIVLEVAWSDRSSDEYLKWLHELETLKAPSLFDMDEEAVKTLKARLIDVQSRVDNHNRKIDNLTQNALYENGIEWRYEFPELLTDDTRFAGFDLVIGNPPDTHSPAISDNAGSKQADYHSYKRTGDASGFFYELANRLLRPDGLMAFVTTGNRTKILATQPMRQYLMEETNPLLMVEFSSSATAVAPDTGMVLLQKGLNVHRMMTCTVGDDFDPQTMQLDDYLFERSTPAPVEFYAAATETSTSAFAIISDTEKQVRKKIAQIGVPLNSWDIQLYSGIATGCDDAFIVDNRIKDEFILADYKNSDLLKPLLAGDGIRRYMPARPDRWLLYLPWHFPLLYDATIRSASAKAEERFKQQYPFVYAYLNKSRDRLAARTGAGEAFEWYTLQRFGSNNEWDDFTQQKIVWKREAPTSAFCFDYGGCAVLDSSGFITGQHLKFLLGVLNSRLGRYMLSESPRLPNGDMQISILTLEALKVPQPNIKIESEVISLVNRRTSDIYTHECEELDRQIDRYVYDLYDLSNDERTFIDNHPACS